MTLSEVFLGQGIVGIAFLVAFGLLEFLAIVMGVARSKTSGYTCLAGAWVMGAAFTAWVANNMLTAAREPGTAAMKIFAANLAAISFFCQPASLASLAIVAILAGARFNKRHVAAEVLLILALVFFWAAHRWYLRGFFLLMAP